jgi:hypothetical protein
VVVLVRERWHPVEDQVVALTSEVMSRGMSSMMWSDGGELNPLTISQTPMNCDGSFADYAGDPLARSPASYSA